MKLIIAVCICVVMLLYLSCQSNEQIEFKRYFTAGAVAYQSRCQNCHGENGEGLSVLIPPLSDTLFLKKNIHSLSCILKNGLAQPITIHHKAYQAKMPANNLSALEIAQILTYVGNSFGNKLNTIPIEQTYADLKTCK